MKTIIGWVVSLLFSMLTTEAVGFEINGYQLDGDFFLSWKSKYVGGVGIIPRNSPVINQELKISDPKTGLYAGIWLSESPNGRKDLGEKQDYYLGKKFISENLGIAVFQYQYANITSIGGLNEFKIGLFPKKIPFFWEINYELWSVKGHKSGFVHYFGLRHLFDLPSFSEQIKIGLEPEFKAALNNGFAGIDNGITNVRFTFSLPIVCGNTALTPFASYQNSD